MKGMLAPKYREVEMGRIEVRQVYKITNVGTVSGCYVLSGRYRETVKLELFVIISLLRLIRLHH